VSEYGQRYQSIAPARGPFRRPKDLIHYDGKVSKDTVQRSDFIEHPVSPPKPKKADEYVPNPNKFDFISEHHDNYTGTRTAPATVPPYLRGITMRWPSAKLEYTSTSQRDFSDRKPNERARLVDLSKSKYTPPKSPFRDNTLHRMDYIRFNQPPIPTARQPDKIQFDGPSSKETTSKTDFTAKELPAKIPPRVEKHVSPEEPFNSTSVFRADFMNHNKIMKRDGFKRESELFKSGEAMQSATTKADDFQMWPVTLPEKKRADIYKRPEGCMDMVATSSDYQHFGNKAVPARSARPKTKLKPGRFYPFEAGTNYNSSFQSWNVPPVKSIAQDNSNFVLPKAVGTLNETSEFLDKYRRHNALPARKFNPISDLFKTDKALDKDSTYKNDFSEKGFSCQTDALLKENSASFHFEKETEDGHRFYQIAEPAQTQILPATEIAVA